MAEVRDAALPQSSWSSAAAPGALERGWFPAMPPSDNGSFQGKCPDKPALVSTLSTAGELPRGKGKSRWFKSPWQGRDGGRSCVCTAEEGQSSGVEKQRFGWWSLIDLGNISKGAELGRCCCSERDWKKLSLKSLQDTSKTAHFLYLMYE